MRSGFLWIVVAGEVKVFPSKLLHIVENYLKFPNILSAGEHDLTAREEFEFESKVKHFGYTTHNSYKEQRTLGVIEYDIAVLELVKPVDFDSYKHIR